MQTLEREDPKAQLKRQEKTNQHFNTSVPITNDGNTHYHTGSVAFRGTKTDTIEKQLDILSPAAKGEVASSLVNLLTQALTSRDAEYV